MRKKNMAVALGLGTAATILIAKLAQAAPPEEGYGNIVVMFVDEDGMPLSDVLVIVDGIQGLSNKSGMFSGELPAGQYTLYYSKSGYEGGSMGFTLLEGQTYNLGTVTMPPTGEPEMATVAGKVTDAVSGGGISGIKVTFQQNNSTVYSTSTNTYGNFTKDVEPGYYQSITFTDPDGDYESVIITSL